MMTRPWLLFIATLQAVVVQGVIGYFHPNVTKPMRNEGLRLTCSLSGAGDAIFYNYNLSPRQISSCNLELQICLPSNYYDRERNLIYRLAANLSTAWVEILSVDRTRDQGLWGCDGNGGKYENLSLTVYSSPVGLSFVSPPPTAVDLAEDSVTLECKTNSCCYPEPTLIAWYYQTNSGPALLNVGTTRRINSTGNCTQQEKIFNIIIELFRGTNFTGNIPMTTTLRCGIAHPVFDIIQFSGNSISVTFAVYVTDVTLYPMKSSITFLDGVAETLACTSSLARPPPKIRWWLDGVINMNGSSENTTTNGSLQSITSELHLKLNKTYQNKQIYCDAQVEGQPSPVNSSIAIINVWYKPTSPSVEPVNVTFPWLENRTGILQCVTADRGNPKASVIWSSSRGIEDSDENLVFSNLSEQDHGMAVTCQLQNNYTMLKNISIVSPNDVTLNVEYTPTITLIPDDKQIRVKETRPLNITCIGTGNPIPKVEWLGRVSPNNVLQFPDVRRNSTGTYTCRASSTSTNYGNVELSREKSAVVIIEYAPDVVVSLSGSTVVNSTVLLMCIPLGEPSQYTFHQWIHKVEETEIRRLSGTNTANASTLTLSNISIEDMGTYTCTVDNSITGLDGQINQTGHTDIVVHGPPFWGEKELLFTGETNRSSAIEIPFYSRSFPMTVRFTRHSGSREIMNTSDTSIYISPADVKLTFYTKMVMIPGYNAVLRFRNVNDTDFDNFTLLLANDQGNASVDFYFIASGPPSVPKKFVLSHYENDLPVFEIEKGFNGGHTQTFIIEYQPVGMPEINWITVLRVNESGLNKTYLIPIPHIPDGYYIFRVYSQNEKGNSIATEGVNITIRRVQSVSSTTSEFPVAAVAGSIGVVITVVALVAIALVLIKRRSSPKQEDIDGEEISSSKRNHHDDSGLVDNPVYDSSGLRPDPSTSTGVEYTAVLKRQKGDKEENPSNLYAQVAKKKQKKQKGDIYENADLTKKTFSPENIYENSADVTTKTYGGDRYESSVAAGSETRLANKDGLLYADLTLDRPTSRNGQPVIRGLENRTEYADIAYGKRGKPLVDINDDKVNSGIN